MKGTSNAHITGPLGGESTFKKGLYDGPSEQVHLHWNLLLATNMFLKHMLNIYNVLTNMRL